MSETARLLASRIPGDSGRDTELKANKSEALNRTVPERHHRRLATLIANVLRVNNLRL
jgi:hypothetical protein